MLQGKFNGGTRFLWSFDIQATCPKPYRSLYRLKIELYVGGKPIFKFLQVGAFQGEFSKLCKIGDIFCHEKILLDFSLSVNILQNDKKCDNVIFLLEDIWPKRKVQ